MIGGGCRKGRALATLPARAFANRLIPFLAGRLDIIRIVRYSPYERMIAIAGKPGSGDDEGMARIVFRFIFGILDSPNDWLALAGIGPINDPLQQAFIRLAPHPHAGPFLTSRNLRIRAHAGPCTDVFRLPPAPGRR